MTSRTRNLAILGVVVLLLVLSLLVIVPGSPLSKDTKLGLDLRGGIELVYQGRPTPQVPEVTQQALDDAVETIRKRTDALGVSEPEIQRSGRDQISIGLPDVQNAQRAIDQVGTTAQLQFYDWEPNVLGDRGGVRFHPEGQGGADRRAAGVGPLAGRGRQGQQHHGRPVLPVRAGPAADRARRKTCAHR
jgi:SecD/SecF fusion protein